MARDKAVSSVTTAAVLDILQGTVQRRDRTDGTKSRDRVDIVESETTTAGNVGHRGDATIAKKKDIWLEISKKGNNHLSERNRPWRL